MYYGDFIQEVNELREKTERIYIYGAGLRGKELCHILSRNGIVIDGFVVTKLEKKAEALGFSILPVESVMHDNVGIIIGLGDIYTEEVVKFLKEKNMDFSRVINGGKYISQDRGSKDLQDNPTVEITTMIGCKVNCKYCPQTVLLQKYYENDKDRTNKMSVEDFKRFLKNTPDNCDFMFAGMVEPFLNPDCIEMLTLACEAGRNVSLYTTLEGATTEDIDKILKLPFQFVGLHVADEMNNAHITVTEEYYKNVERLINAEKENGEPFINDISAQANPLPRILEMCKGKYEVLVSLQDRAGNLEGTELAGRETMLTTEKITCCFSGPKLNNHVVLPDGTLLLCNMDYGMKHVLGNLKENTYDEIRNGEEMQKVFRGINGDESIDLLCRKCLFAMVVRE